VKLYDRLMPYYPLTIAGTILAFAMAFLPFMGVPDAAWTRLTVPLYAVGAALFVVFGLTTDMWLQLIETASFDNEAREAERL